MKISKTFTLIELILVVAIVAILAAAMIPHMQGVQEDAKVAKLLQLADTLKGACELYHSDTGTYAIESSPAPPTNALAHGLAMDDGKAGWDGPYIDHHISWDDSPYNFVIIVGLLQPPIHFDLDGDGTDDRTTGNNLQIRSVPDSAAKKINDKLDSHLGDSDWENTGRVEHMGSNIVNIYLIGRE
ncbi:MAG: prepilin-type N-terminal cleavage/methylation domain-containing protein [Nitrospirota bacterium]